MRGNLQALFGKRPTEKDPTKGTSSAVDFTLRGRRRGNAPPLPDWKPFYYLLEDLPGAEVMLVNARHVKNLPGRKTDVAGGYCATTKPTTISTARTAHRTTPRR